MNNPERPAHPPGMSRFTIPETPVFFTPDIEPVRAFSEPPQPVPVTDALSVMHVEFARKKKPTGRKEERRKEKLPNHIRHDRNAAIAVGTWKKRGKKGNGA